MTTKKTIDKVLEFIISEDKENRHYNAPEISLKLGIIKNYWESCKGNYYWKLEKANKIYIDTKTNTWYPIKENL